MAIATGAELTMISVLMRRLMIIDDVCRVKVEREPFVWRSRRTFSLISSGRG